ncbi:MAG TPA: lysophospholipid acyltransferase family protein [Gemmatimonadaceae bacterium]|nr:lysophospholipid acyltransferase family protein [Gemmatimonadaceae bacterium]
MLYRILHWLTALALRWFYRDVEIVGLDRVPAHGPVLLAVNHPNAVVDAMTVIDAVPRRVTLTAKATLFDNPLVGAALRAIGAVPLRRASDEARREPRAALDPARNRASFEALVGALGRGAAVLFFPEGKSHSEPALAPLRTGLARVALEARDAHGVRGITIVPIGLVFEEKWRPRTRIVVQAGEPLLLDAWVTPPGDGAVETLTREVDARLRAMTLNFASAEDAARVIGAARLLAGAADEARPVRVPAHSLVLEVELVRRIERARRLLRPATEERAAAFLSRLDALREELARRRIASTDVTISPGLLPGGWFLLREGSVAIAAGAVALWGRVNHAIPLAIARTIARRTSRAPEDPAMHTLLLAVALLLVAYVVQTAAAWRWVGPWWALLYLATLPIAGLWDQRHRDRMRRAVERARAYLVFRRHPALQRQLVERLAELRDEGRALEAELTAEGGTPRPDPSATHPA